MLNQIAMELIQSKLKPISPTTIEEGDIVFVDSGQEVMGSKVLIEYKVFAINKIFDQKNESYHMDLWLYPRRGRKHTYKTTISWSRAVTEVQYGPVKLIHKSGSKN